MRGLIFSIAGLLLASPVFCQVDTLQLVEIGSIEAPAEITNLYIEDLDGDDLKEIILTTATNIHIYNGITYEERWTSPGLVNPQDLLFEDINNDSLIDLSVRDSLNISLFDPLNFATIWTSPPIDSTYSCYTIGDRNDDEWIDVAIVSKEAFSRWGDWENVDTVWVDIFDGPSFPQSANFESLMSNWTVGLQIVTHHREYPIKISINEISFNSILLKKISLYSRIYESQSGHGGVSAHVVWGNLRLVNPINFREINIENVGTFLSQRVITIDSSSILNLISRKEEIGQTSMFSWDNRYKYHHMISADTIISTDTIWYSEQYAYFPDQADHIDWEGFIFDDILESNSGFEIVFGAQDSLYFLSMLNHDYIWITPNIENLAEINFTYHSDIYPDDIKIMCHIGNIQIGYQFFSGSDGSLSAVLPEPGFDLTNMSDLDIDGIDEVLSIQNNSLYIYNLDYATSIGNDTRLPNTAYLLSNYPNPFNSSTTIEYGLPEARRITIQIYDLLGRKVATVVDDRQDAGTYQVVWDAGDRSSGVYFYRITSGEFTETKRMVLLK